MSQPTQNSDPSQPKSGTLIRLFVWFAAVCCLVILYWSWHFSPGAEIAPTRAPTEIVQLTSVDRGVRVPAGLGVSVRQIVNAVNTPHASETESGPQPAFAAFKKQGTVQCYQDRSEECFLVLTGDSNDVQLISVWLKTGPEPSSLPVPVRRSRRYDLFDQVIDRTVAALDPGLATGVRRWAIDSIPLAMRNEAGTFAEWGRWMTKVKFDGSGDQRYLAFLGSSGLSVLWHSKWSLLAQIVFHQ